MIHTVQEDSYRAVLRVLQDSCVAQSASLRPGSRAALFSAIDDLRASGAPPRSIDIVERAALATHRLHYALRAKDEVEAISVQAELSALSQAWACC